MTIDYTLHIILWLCSIVLPGQDATWVVKGEQGPPLALVKTATGFELQPPKGVDAPTLPVTIAKTKVTMGDGKRPGMSTDVKSHLSLTKPFGANFLREVVCKKKGATGCFDTVSVGTGRAQITYVNGAGKTTTWNFQRVGD